MSHVCLLTDVDEEKLKEIGSKTVSSASEGARLDKFMLELLPESGLRERRRLIENGYVLVNGKTRKTGFKVFSGAVVTFFEPEERACSMEIASRLSIVGEEDEYAVIHKPSDIHSAWVAGSREPTAEECLSDLFPGKEAILANRLDKLTSGLLLIAFGAENENRFREQEDAGHVEKFYYAKVHGVPDGGFIVKNKLDTADRKRTKVLKEYADPVRWSLVEMVGGFDDGTALVEVRISKGARHQIRAHLAYAGFPIVGDPLYGVGGEQGLMYLHHRRIVFPGFEAVYEPEW